VPAFVAVPLADAFGWRISLGVWALAGFAAALPWVWVLLRRRGVEAEEVSTVDQRAPGKVWRSPVGWGMAGMFGMTSLITYSMFTWIPDVLADAGASRAFGGVMVGLFALLGLVSAFGAPSLCARMENPFPVVLACAACFLVGFAGLWLAPMSAPILWVVLLGLGPSTFPMALTLINLRSRTPFGSAALSGFTQGVGYTAACLGPLLFGVFHDLTSGWTASFAFMTVAVMILVTAAYQACKPRMVEDSWRAGIPSEMSTGQRS